MNVSVMVPLYNEEESVFRLVKNLMLQTYPHDEIEVLFIDGGSTDNTVEKLKNALSQVDFTWQILTNPTKSTSRSLNIAIQEAKGEYIVRLDGHSEYDQKYIKWCILYLNKMDAANAGCRIIIKETSFFRKIIAAVYSSSFGVGNAQFRIATKAGYVDTVPYGCFRRELFDQIGLFREDLIRSEDNELNHRIRQAGKKIYLFTDCTVTYHVRKNIPLFLKMGFDNGKSVLYTQRNYPGSMGMRHFVPVAFLLFLLVFLGGVMGHISFLVKGGCGILGLYSGLDLAFTLDGIAKQRLNLIAAPVLLLLYPAFHLSYGIGTFVGIFTTKKKKEGNGR